MTHTGRCTNRRRERRRRFAPNPTHLNEGHASFSGFAAPGLLSDVACETLANPGSDLRNCSQLCPDSEFVRRAAEVIEGLGGGISLIVILCSGNSGDLKHKVIEPLR